MRKTILFVLLSLLMVSLSACVSLAEDVTPPANYQAPTAVQTIPTPSTPAYPVSPPDPERGAPLYAEKCAPCHGAQGLGDGPDASQLSVAVAPIGDPDLARQSVPADWYNLITNGNLQRFMPPFRSLSVNERWDVIAYVYSLSTSEELLTQGRQLYLESCVICHGDQGQGDGPQSASLADSPLNFTDQAFMGVRSQSDLAESIAFGAGEMHAFGDFTESQIWSLTAYLRSLTFVSSVIADVSETPAEVPAQAEPAAETLEEPQETLVVDGSDGLGTVNVAVSHASDGILPADLEVILRGYQGMVEVFSNTLSLTAGGVAVFESVELYPDLVIFATLEADEMVYGSDIAQLTAGIQQINLEIVYYEPTRDASIISADRLHIFFDFLPDDLLQVYMLYIFSNTSDQVVIGDSDTPPLQFVLPASATDLRVQDSMQLVFVETPNGFGATNIYPSTEPYQVMYSFVVPYPRDKAELSLQLAMDTNASIVMVPGSGVKIKSEQLQESGLRDIQGVSYTMYNGDRLNGGDTLLFTLSGQPKVAADLITASEEGNQGLVIGLGAFGLALVGVGLYLWRRNQVTAEDFEEDEDEFDDDYDLDEDDPEILLDDIVAIDDLFQAGELSEADYQERRAVLKARLQRALGDE